MRASPQAARLDDIGARVQAIAKRMADRRARVVTITVVLYAGLDRYRPAGAQGRHATLELADGARVRDVLRRLDMPDDLSCIPVVNGTWAGVDRVLRDGETLSLFPPLAGGGEPQRAAARRWSDCHALRRHRG